MNIIYSGICKLETGSGENYSRNPEYETKKRFQDQILQRTPIQGYCLCKKINILILQTYGNDKRSFRTVSAKAGLEKKQRNG